MTRALYLYEGQYTFFNNISLNSSWSEKCFGQKEAVKKIKTHILCSINFFFENYTVYEIIWKEIL